MNCPVCGDIMEFYEVSHQIWIDFEGVEDSWSPFSWVCERCKLSSPWEIM